MSSLIKLKQIKDGIALQNDVNNLKVAVGEIDTRIDERIEAANLATSTELESHINNEGTGKHVTAEDIVKWNAAAAVVGELTGDEEGGLGSITGTINAAIAEHATEADNKYATIANHEALADRVTANETNIGKNSDDILALDNRVGTLPEGTSASNIVAYIDFKTETLTSAMHFRGVSTTDPSTGDVTVTNVTEFISGDVVIYGNKEFVYDGFEWKEFGDETIYAIKGEIEDSDIAANANIAQSKISGLTDALNAKATVGSVDAVQGEINTLKGSDTGSIRSIAESAIENNVEKCVTKSVAFASITNNPNVETEGTYTGFTVPLTPDTGYTVVGGTVKVIVNSISYIANNVAPAATSVTVNTGWEAEDDDEIYIEFYVKKSV